MMTRLKTKTRSLPSCDNANNDGGNDDGNVNGEQLTPVSEGDAEETVPTPIVTNAEVEKRYTFRLSLDGCSWFVRNNENGKYMNRLGNEQMLVTKFGSDKNKAYELIKQKIEKEMI